MPDPNHEGRFQLAEINVARARAPLDHETMASFIALLDEVNAAADASPGFVWRLAGEPGQAAYVLDDDLLLINLSVWESLDALHRYVYEGPHVAVLRRRRDWFERFHMPSVAMWWIPRGEIPTVDDARARLDHLTRHGPSLHAFTFGTVFTPDGCAR